MKTKMLTMLCAAAGVALSGCAASKGAYSGNIEDDVEKTSSSSSAIAAAAVAEETAGAIQPDFMDPAKKVNDERSDPDSPLGQRLVYFDYDKSVVPAEALAILDAHIDFLLRNPDKNLLVAGHADERGSNEYNLALGQRRANAVRDIIVAGGVGANRVEPLSFGETDPINPASNEEAWRQNRRAELRYSDE